MCKSIILTIFFISLNLILNGKDITGKIIDANGVPIQDAYILNADGSFHASSNELGKFICKDAQIGDTLTISYLGYESKQIVIKADNFNQTLTIILEDKYFELDQVYISNSIKAINQVANIDLKTKPVNSSQEILRKVPGLFIGQHAGGGKAEQLFLRGFDIDHGTDISISVDDIPVNMVSHAHGQGYADLHFLIPETIERLDFGKGPYYADKGNFTTAGYVNFQTKESLENSSIGLEIGQFNTKRAVALIDLLEKVENQHAYFAGEYILSDGPFESPQDFNRLNLMGKYSINLKENDKFSILLSHFNSEWMASGQIPQRAVDSGLIGRFGAIDDTEGGATSRTNVALKYIKALDNQSYLKNRIFYSNYNFELFSNFTFFANDPVNGDQIKQKENRHLFGLESSWNKEDFTSFGNITYQIGAGLRHDQVNNIGLWRTLNRTSILSSLAQGAVDETNYYGFAYTSLNFDKFSINPGLRIDYFDFKYANDLRTNSQKQTQNAFQLSPKLNFIYNPNRQVQLFLKSGIGFHSNDTRVVIAQDAKEILPLAFGVDLGASWKVTPKLWFNTALWYLYLQQEFVYVGDEGIVEPSGKTRRVGLDLGFRWQLHKYLFFDTDFNYTIARSIEEPSDADLIPLAPQLTMTGGLDLELPNRFGLGLHYRYIKDRPATEDNSIVAEGYFITDLNINYTIKHVNFGLIIENLFDSDWNEAQFATESRLQNEAMPVEELHFTPGSPFYLRAKVTYSF